MKKELVPIISLLPLVMAAQRQKPNIVMIVADDLGYGDLSCYGATAIATPTIDSLANNGVRFTNMHACAATSTPSRYGILTGEYPFRRQGTDVAAGNAGMIIKPSQVTVADIMRKAGYSTAAIGKWHLGLGSKTAAQDWNGCLDQSPRDLGFDYHYIMAATSDRVPCVFIENGKVANYDSSAPISVSYIRNFDGEPTGESNPELLTKLKPSHGHNQSIVNGISRIGYMKGGGKALWTDENIADSIVSHAISFIDHSKEKPFFIYLCTNDVHVPRMPHERFRGKSAMGLRGEAIMQFDWTVKQIADALRQRCISDNTIIIITSDNGPVLDDGYQDRAKELVGSHKPAGPWRGWKYSAYEGGSAVPFIVYWPDGAEHGVVSDALVSLIDTQATLSAAAGQESLCEAFTDSQNHLSTWLGHDMTPRDYAVSMAQNRSLTLRTQRYKYIEPSNGKPMITWGPEIETGYRGVPQLFDISKSKYEATDVSATEPDTLRKMGQMLSDIKERNVTYVSNDARNKAITLFSRNDGSRIPAIVKTGDNSLLAISDRRKNGADDIGFGNIDLVAKMATNNGKTWIWTDEITIIAGNDTAGFGKAHGDAAVVADMDNPKNVIIMCASGDVSYWKSMYSEGRPIRIGRIYSDNGGVTWSGADNGGECDDVTTDIYKLYNGVSSPKVEKIFFSSGRICQSRRIKVKNHYRLYAALTTNRGSLVVCSDDFGRSWQTLGSSSDRPAPDGDEAKIEELPDGSVLLSARGKNCRWFNIFRYTSEKTWKKRGGSWSKPVSTSAAVKGGIATVSCNGEILIVPAKRNSDGRDVYVVLQSVATGYGKVTETEKSKSATTARYNRYGLAIYYKEISSPDDFDTPNDFCTDWHPCLINTTASAYSSMALDDNSKIVLLYEDNFKFKTNDQDKSGGKYYDINFISLSLFDDITGGAYTLRTE